MPSAQYTLLYRVRLFCFEGKLALLGGVAGWILLLCGVDEIRYYSNDVYHTPGIDSGEVFK